MLEQVVKKYHPLNDYLAFGFAIQLPETDKSEQFQLLITDNHNIQELLDDNFYVLAELLLKIRQNRYMSALPSETETTTKNVIVFVTIENIVYRPIHSNKSQIIYYDDAGYGDILDKNGSRFIPSNFKYKDILFNPVLDCLCDNAAAFLSYINNDLRKTLDLVEDKIGCV